MKTFGTYVFFLLSNLFEFDSSRRFSSKFIDIFHFADIMTNATDVTDSIKDFHYFIYY